MMDDHSGSERDLGNGNIYYRNRGSYPSSPQIVNTRSADTPKRTTSVSWAEDVIETNTELSRKNGVISVHQNGCVKDRTKNGLTYPGVLKSQHIEGGKSACVVEIRRNSVQNDSKQTSFTSSSTHNDDNFHLRRGSDYVDLMKNRRLESLRKNADVRNRSEHSLALLGQFDDRDKPYRSKVDFFAIALTFMLGLGNVVRFSYLCHQNGGGRLYIWPLPSHLNK
jgi:hypothetical protein